MEVVRFLESAGLVKWQGAKLVTGETHIHLKKVSPYAFFASQQMRLRMLERLDMKNEKALHFSLNYSISKKNLAIVKQRVLEFISELNKDIESEDPETMCTLILDLCEF